MNLGPGVDVFLFSAVVHPVCCASVVWPVTFLVQMGLMTIRTEMEIDKEITVNCA